MADKKYQIFVSSTYKDLVDERLEVLNTILNMGHIPAGMEYFPAMDERQLHYIYRVIDQSDYFVLILAGKYGSVDNEGISYTEREYDYAVKQNKPVIALIHENTNQLPREKTETNKKNIKKLAEFQNKVKNGRLVKNWTNKDTLAKIFAISLPTTIQDFPSTGWMRGNSVANPEIQKNLRALKQENKQLKEQLAKSEKIQPVTSIKMEACSITNINIFSENEIECIALRINILNESETQQLFECKDGKYFWFTDEMKYYYQMEAIPWFCNMANICRIDLRITNPNLFELKIKETEEHFFDIYGNEITHTIENDQIVESPHMGNYNTSPMSKPINQPKKTLLSKQSTMYTHARYFKIDHDYNMTYRRLFWVSKVNEPICKEIKVHFLVKNIEIDFKDMIGVIRSLENKNKFNDAGVFDWVNSVLVEARWI